MSGMECRKCGATDMDDVSLFLFPHDDSLQLSAWEKYVGPEFVAKRSSRLCHVNIFVVLQFQGVYLSSMISVGISKRPIQGSVHKRWKVS